MTQDIQQKPAEQHNISSTPANPKPNKRTHRWAKSIPWYCDIYNPVYGECGLWLAVITQAMMDALNRTRNPEHQKYRDEAIKWLTGNSVDFHFVCLLAGMDADEVRRRAKKAIVSPTRWRAEPGAGVRYTEKKYYRERVKREDAPPKTLPEEKSNVITGPWQ